MTTKCCPKCADVDFEKTYPEHTAREVCSNTQCKCHTSRVSEVIAEAVKEHRSIYGASPIADAEDAWLTTTLNRVASAAREELLKEQEEAYEPAQTVSLKKIREEGAQAMKEKILAALPEGFGWQVTSKTDVGGDTDNEYGFDVAIATVRRIITDLK